MMQETKLLRRNYAFWKIFRNFYYLFCMANLMYRDKCKPIVETELAEERMPPVMHAQIARFCFFQERQSLFADTAQLIQHQFFVGKQLCVDWNRRFAANQALFHDY